MRTGPPPPLPGVRRRRATLRDVAAGAGVSVTTASFVLNNRTDFKISADTRERVRAAAASLEYRPHHLARSLSQGKSCLLGVLVGDLTSPYSWQIATTLERESFAAGYGVVLFGADRSVAIARDRIERILSLHLDGVLINPTNFADFVDAHARRDMERTTPAVCFGASPDPLGANPLPGCYLDAEVSCYLAARHLLERGHRRIAFLAHYLPWDRDWDRDFVRERLRYRGYCRALVEAGLPIEDERLISIRAPGEPIDDVLHATLADERGRPTGIVAYNDMAALAACRVALAMGLRVPGDLAVVGVDDIGLAALVYPPLTTVSQRIDEGAAIAARMLIRMIDEPGYGGETVVLDPLLVVRDST